MSKIKIANRTLSTKDDISLSESLKLIKHFRKDTDTGLIIPDDLKQERKKVCGYCGRPFEPFQLKGKYFGEIFHDKCCQAMLRGERNE